MIGAAHTAAARPREERQAEIVTVLVEASSELLARDPEAFRAKFRKMAASPFAFYRGSAPLFYADMARVPDAPGDPRAARVWIQGDLHAENFGTYMDADGRLVFDVNDFDESYVGHFGWDLGRLAASLALLGFAKAFSDEDIRAALAACAGTYAGRIEAFVDGVPRDDFALTLERTDGPLHAVLERARVRTRSQLLDSLSLVEGCERLLRRDGRTRDLDAAERGEVEAAFAGYLETVASIEGRGVAEPRIKDVVAVGGIGIGSAGLPAYTLLLEGPTDALDTDVLISMKQANVCAPSRVVTDPHVGSYFADHGVRTVLSQRALQAHSDPWLGHTVLRGEGQVVKELSPFEEDLDWGEVNEPAEVARVAGELGGVVARIHSVADAHTDRDLVPFAAEEAIGASIGDPDRFVEDVCDFALAYGDVVRDDHRLFVDAFRNHRIAGL